MVERLQKFISGAGVASRRHAEEMILAGRVRVNGKVVKKLGTKVDAEKDSVSVDGKKINLQKFIYLAFNKPKRYMTTRFDPERRKTIYDLLPAKLKNIVWPVGRLDFNTEGLLILTNDGELTQQLAHPSREHEKEYVAELDRPITENKLEKLQQGVVIDGKKTSPAKAWANENIVHVIIHEGRNRQIRKMFAALNYTVRNLKRIRIGKLHLKGIPVGEFKTLDKKEIV